MRANEYKLLARYYDRIFTRHPAWFVKVRRELLSPILPNVKVACDIACGTGTTALLLARKGIEVYAVDLSAEMCRATREKARDAGMDEACRQPAPA